MPAEAWARVIVRWIETILLQTGILEGLEYVSQEEHVSTKVEVMVIPNIFAPKGFPDLFYMLVDLV